MDNTEITELSNILFAALDTLMAIYAEMDKIDQQIDDMRFMSKTNATMHWRPDSKGERTILELLHPTGSEYEQRTGRRREYIGKDPEKIAEAKEAKKCYREWQELISRGKHLESAADRLHREIIKIDVISNGIKLELWGHENTALINLVSPNNGDGDRNGLRKATGTKEMSPGDSLQAVPILSTEKMSPNDVVNYFNNSDELRDLVPDLPKSFFS